MSDNATLRFDPEYFNKAAIAAFRIVGNQRHLGDLVKDGYRVVYENTKVVDREQGLAEGLPFFLQSADISTPFINENLMVCVPESEWIRYPKGRIQKGELLIEVKGRAQKVAVVPDDFPSRTLVTGTCFKIRTKRRAQRSLLLAFLIGKYGSLLKNRLKTNLLVSYISKSDLYRIPLPELSVEFEARIDQVVELSLSLRRTILLKQADAEGVLLAAIGLADWTPPEPLSYTARASDTCKAARLDAQYFMPAKEQVRRSLDALQGQTLEGRTNSIREMFVPDRELITEQVRNYDVTDALIPLLDVEKAPSMVTEIGSVKKVLKDGDVAVSRLRAYLKEIAVVRTGDGVRSVGSSEFIVLRPKDDFLSPEALMTFLRSAPVQTILKWCQDGSQHPRFSERDLLEIPIPDAVTLVSAKITKIVQSGFSARHRSRRLLEAAKRAVEIAIENGEAAAMTYLDREENAT